MTFYVTMTTELLIENMHCEEVSNPKAIKIKQYFSTTHFSVNNRHFVIQSSQTTQLYITKVFMRNVILSGKIKYQTSRVPSCFNCLINLNQKILILLRFVTKNDFHQIFTNKTTLYYERIFINNSVVIVT
jgi:hypothetical protein